MKATHRVVQRSRGSDYGTQAGARKPVIRNGVAAPAAVLVRALVRAAAALARAALAWAPAGLRDALVGAVRTLLEIVTEYPLYILGWLGWVLDWAFRGPALWICALGRMPSGELSARVTLLLPAQVPVEPALLRTRSMFEEASSLLREHGIALAMERVSIQPPPPGLAAPTCGVSGIFSRFFSWASARGGVSPLLTIYVVPDLGPLAGCAFPGADWILVDLSTDGTTVVHEIGHLADLWPHHEDPDNVMTAKPGGSHDRMTAGQRAMIRTCRFVGRAPASRSEPRARSRD